MCGSYAVCGHLLGIHHAPSLNTLKFVLTTRLRRSRWATAGLSCVGGRCGMSFVIAQPDLVATAATNLANIGSAITEANAAAAGQTTAVLAAGADEVSAAVAALFGAHAQSYQALSAEAVAFHQQFVQLMNSGASAYASTEAANAAATANPWQVLQQNLLNAI